MKSLKLIKIFISCPDEIIKDGILDKLRKIIEDDNIYFRNYGFIFDIDYWKANIYLGKGKPRVQDTINEELLENCDIYLCILWTKFGSSPGQNREGKDYGSGTEEEFYYAKRLNKKLWVIFYNKPKKPSEINPQQLEKVRKFKENVKKEQIWYAEFENHDELSKIIKNNLLSFINEKYSFEIKEKEISPALLPNKTEFSKYNRGF